MQYGDYMGNVTRLAVELVNHGGLPEPSDLARAMFGEHRVALPADGAFGELPALVGTALGELADGASPVSVQELLRRYPPEMHLSDHDGEDGGRFHIHWASDGAEPELWLGQLIAAKFALVAAGDPSVTLGRCAATGCPNFFVDQSRNRTRRFCSNACASRTTVAAYRARSAEA